MIKNIIFDWAGCLVDNFSQSYEVSMLCFDSLGIKRITKERYRNEFVLPYMNFYRKYTAASKKKVDVIFIEHLQRAKKPELFSSTRKTLRYLHKKGVRMTMLSSHPQKELEHELSHFRIRSHFLKVSGSVHDKTKVINKHIKNSGFIKKETLYVGDMTHDIDAGRKAKVKVAAVYWGYQPKKVLAKRKPEFLIRDIKELKKIIS